MNHNWGQLAHVLAVARMDATVQPQPEGSGYADVLVQVTLPIILFLALVLSLVSQSYEQSRVALEALQGTETIRELDTALLDAQFQKILLALMQVKREEEDHLRLPYYRDKAALVRLDPDFKELGERSANIFGTAQAKEEKATALYNRVLTLSNVDKDPAKEVVRLLDLKSYITPKHASYIESQLAGWLEQVESQVTALQLRIVTQLLQARVAQPPSELSTREQQLIDQLRGARAGRENAAPYWTALAALYVGKLQDQLVRDGYQFLPRTWQVLKALKW